MMLSFQFSSSEHNHCLTQIYQNQGDANSVIKFPAIFFFFWGGEGEGQEGVRRSQVFQSRLVDKL